MSKFFGKICAIEKMASTVDEFNFWLARGQSDKVEVGYIVTAENEIIGWHSGVHNYTVGQRKRLGISASQPLYVIEIRANKNEVVVGSREDLLKNYVCANNINCLFDQLSHHEMAGKNTAAKIRSYGEPVMCKVTDADNEKLSVKFDKPVFAPTPGQHLVLYDMNSNIIAGGIIC